MPNLLNKLDILELYRKGIFFNEGSLNEIISTLNIFSDLSISPDMLNFDGAGLLTLNEHGLQRNIPIIEIFKFAKKLTALKQCQGFNSLAVSLNNETQFADTMFEIDCAYSNFIKPAVTKLELSPQVIVNGKIKRPDFRFVTTSGREFFCECKSIASAPRIKRSKVMRFMQQFEPHLTAIPANRFRIEIAFKNLPPHWNRNYPKQLTESIKTLIEKRFLSTHTTLIFDKKYETYIKICSFDEDPYFNCLIKVGNKPPSENPTLIVGELQNLKKDIRKAIRDALTQLPHDQASFIYLYTLNEKNAKEAITSFFNENNTKNLCGIFSWTKDLNYYNNPKSGTKLTNYLTSA